MPTDTRKSIHGEWSSRWTFVFAASGAAVGLGNIWKFPYITDKHGGGAFVLIYLFCIAVIGIPLLMAEILIGRYGRRNPATALAITAQASGRSRLWSVVGFGIILSGFLILSYYSVITGWTLDYVFKSMSNVFYHASTDKVASLYNQLVASPWRLLGWQSVVMLATIAVVARGVKRGIEKTVLVMFPSMFILLLIVLVYAMGTGYFMQGVEFILYPDLSELTSSTALVALGHAFFTLSLATGSIMMYGAYLPRKISITRSAVLVTLADTSIALIAGLATFPIVFANHLTPGMGPGLIFRTLPLAFGQMPYGSLIATLFFMMLFLAAFSSAISLLEPSVAWLMETFHVKRKNAAMLAGFAVWFIGLGTVFSFNLWEHVKFFGLNFFDSLDYLTANFMLPVCGFFVAVFTSWFLSHRIAYKELAQRDRLLFRIWYFTLRYIAPGIILILFLNFIGVIHLSNG